MGGESLKSSRTHRLWFVALLLGIPASAIRPLRPRNSLLGK